MFFTKSVKIVVVVTIFNFPESCEKSSQEVKINSSKRRDPLSARSIGLILILIFDRSIFYFKSYPIRLISADFCGDALTHLYFIQSCWINIYIFVLFFDMPLFLITSNRPTQIISGI